MFSTRGKYPARTSRLRAWRKGDREIAEKWAREYRALLRNPQPDHPRKAVKLLLDMTKMLRLPTTDLIRVYVAKGPIEMQQILKKVTPPAGTAQAYYLEPWCASWPKPNPMAYSLGGVPDHFCNQYFNRSGWGWGRPSRSRGVTCWPAQIARAADFQARVAEDYTAFPSLWDTYSACFAHVFCARGLRLDAYRDDAASYALLQTLQCCWDAVLSASGSWLVVCRSPKVVKVDEYGILHATSGPALAWEDDLSLDIRRGVILPELPTKDGKPVLTLDRIRQERNQEVRSILVELYGEERFLRESGYYLAATDERGSLWKQTGTNIAYVKVTNSTPEPDGSFRVFYLPVPAATNTPTEAVGWTFQKQDGQYRPVFES